MKTLITFILFSSFLFANINLTKEEQNYIKNNPIVKIGLTNDKPFTFTENGKIKGLTKDILDEISKQTNLKFNIKQNIWIENFKDFKDGKIDIISDLFYKQDRESFTLYSKAYVKLPLVIFGNKTYPDFKSFQEFNNIKVGLVKGSNVIESLKTYSNVEIVVFNNQNDQISALSFGKIDFALQTLHTANIYIKRNFFTNIYPIQNYDDSKYYESLHFGVNKQKPLLQLIINKALNNINLNDIEKKWFELKVNRVKIALSKKEKEFLKAHPVIILGTEKAWEPYVIQNNDGSIDGYDVDILNKINELTGANFQLKLGSWSEMKKEAREKKIDGLSTGAIHDERKTYLNFSDIYISLQKMLIVKHRNPLNIKSKKDLEGKTIVIHKGNLVDEKLAYEFPKSNIIKLDTVEQMLKEVIYGKADATFGNGATEYLANKMGLPYLDFAFPLDHRLELAFGIRTDWPEAVSIINKALKAIREHEKLNIKQKWFFLSEYEKKYRSIKNKVTLSVDEKLYLKENPTINLCIDPDYYPFEFLNQYKKHDGLISQLLNIINTNIGINTKLIKTTSWSESLKFLETKRCDIVASVQKTIQREKYLDFTSSYITIPLVIATKSSLNFIDDFTKVSNKIFVMVKGYASIDLIKEKYKDIKIIEVENISQGLSFVLSGKAFGFIDTVPTIIHAIKQNGYHDIHINGKVDINSNLRIATIKTKPILNSIYEKGVKTLSIKEKEEAFDNWINITNIKEADYKIFWQIFGGLIFIVFVVLIWNRQLKKKTDEAIQRYKEQESLLFHYSKQKSMGELIGNISHQWRHPLSELSGNIMNLETKQKLNKNISNDDLHNLIISSKRTISFLSDTIDTFYNFYKNKQENKVFNIEEIINDILLISKGSFEIHGIKVITDIDNKLSLNSNQNEFKQLILILVANAKSIFISRNIKNPEIIITCKKFKNNLCEVKIIDNAGGIETSSINKIFDIGFSENEGTGRGLHIAKLLSKKNKINLKVSNTKDGAEFSLNFEIL